MKTLQESVNFILADESMRYVEQDGRVRETGTRLFYKYFGEQKEKLKSKDYQILKKWVLEEIKTVNLFYVPDLKLEEKSDKKIAPPFKNCWFELNPAIDIILPEEHDKVTNYFEKPLGMKLSGKHFLNGFGLLEVQPNRYILIFNTTMFEKDVEKNIELGGVQSVEMQPFDIENPYCRHGQENLIKAVFSVLNRFEKTKITYLSNAEGFQERGRVNGEFTKIKYKPSDVIYLSGIRELKKRNPELSHRIISKPAYAYEVMGHWRKVDNKTIGKDREGKREVHGYTWVVPHTRGEGELFKKTRILKAGVECCV